MNGKRSLTRSRRFRDRVTAVLATAGVIVMTTGLTLMAVANPAGAVGNDNPGNNGTVKVAATGDIDTIPDNEPHLPCTFTVQWYNFGAPDEGDPPFIGDVSFALQQPTADAEHSLTVESGDVSKLIEQDAPGGAGNDFDGEEIYTLSFTGDPQPQQGYHVKITVTTPDSKGNDTKHKVFWVGPCDTPPPPVDVCPNIEGDQATVPVGLIVDDEGDCVEPPTILDVCPNIAGNQDEVPAGLVKVDGECAEIAGTETASPTPDKKPTVKGTEAVPTAVDAGIGGGGPTMTGTSPIDLLAQMLVGGGLALLMAAGWLQIGRQTRGVHQA